MENKNDYRSIVLEESVLQIIHKIILDAHCKRNRLNKC
jgi:hypothetical protein